jgi:hypothetical protein
MLCSTWAFAEHIPGTHVELDPPPGFAPATQFTGVYRQDYNASIVVVEMPAPVSETTKGFTTERMARSGMKLLDSSKARVDGVDALLLHVSQEAASDTYDKWILVAGDDTHTTMINGIFPQAHAAELDAPIKRAVLSTKWHADAPQDMFEGLNFRVQPTADLKFAGRMVNYLILTESGKMAAIDPNEGRCLIGNDEHRASIDDPSEFAKARLLSLRAIGDAFKDFADVQGEPIRVDGIPAYERLVNAVRRKNEVASQIYQVIVPYSNRFDEIICYGPTTRMTNLLPQFRQITASFKRMP